MKQINLPVKTSFVLAVLIISALLLSACNGIQFQIPSVSGQASPLLESKKPAETIKAETAPNSTAQNTSESEVLAAYQNTLQDIYTRVSPSVVNIRVVQDSPVSGLDLNQLPQIPGLPDMPFFNNPDSPENSVPELQPFAQGLGSGFVWDTAGHIVTNNHVVESANKIEVTFADGTTSRAELVGADSDSDLAVIKVDRSAEDLIPVDVADSENVKVGQLAIAIGNPFGLEGTMTVGIVSALGRTLPTEMGLGSGPSYSIPDIIQTDAPINPGNSGGVLLNSLGQVIGVTAAIESPVQANAGIGFVIPSRIVQKVVPVLIERGAYEHPWIGISLVNLSPDLAESMQLDPEQQGVLVAEVMPDSPAERANLQTSNREVTIDGQTINVGGDIITAIDGQSIQSSDELISYLSKNSSVGQTIKLTILRDGSEQNVELTLAARPERQASQANESPEQPEEQAQPSGSVYLGITGLPMTPQIADEMNVDSNQSGVLVQQVEPGSPAEEAGLKGGETIVTMDEQEIRIGGDIITKINGQTINQVNELRSYLQQFKAGDEVTLTILRNGNEIELPVTLAVRPG